MIEGITCTLAHLVCFIIEAFLRHFQVVISQLFPFPCLCLLPSNEQRQWNILQSSPSETWKRRGSYLSCHHLCPLPPNQKWQYPSRAKRQSGGRILQSYRKPRCE